MNAPKRIARLAVTTLLAAGAAVAALATPAAADVSVQISGCQFELVLVKANELQESGDRDEIYLIIGDDRTRTLTFVERQSRLGSEFGTSAQITEFIELGRTLKVQVWEADFPSADDHLGNIIVPCSTTQLGTFTKTANLLGSNYAITYHVIGLP